LRSKKLKGKVPSRKKLRKKVKQKRGGEKGMGNRQISANTRNSITPSWGLAGKLTIRRRDEGRKRVASLQKDGLIWGRAEGFK